MKNSILLFFTLLFSSLAFGEPQVAKLTIVEGHVYNHSASPESQTIIINILDITGWRRNTVYSAQLDKHDNFKITFHLYTAQDAQLLQEGLSTWPIVNDIIIHPGDRIHISLDFKTLTNITFTGDAAKTNNDLFNYTTNVVDMWKVRGDSRLFQVRDAGKYKTIINTIKDELTRKTSDFEVKVHPNQETRTWLENNLTLFRYTMLAAFFPPAFKSTVDQAKVSAYVALNPADVNEIFNSHLLNASAYQLLSVLLPSQDNDVVYAQYSPGFLAMIDDTARKYNNKQLSDLLKAKALNATLFTANTADFYKNKPVFDAINRIDLKLALARRFNLAAFNNKDHIAAVTSYSKSLQGTVAGRIIDSLIAAHKNKVIYIDFWATWCSACIGEMPNSRKMAEKYLGKDLVFAYICLSSPKDLWAKVAPGLHVTGDHIFCDTAQSRSLGKAFNMRGIPFYILINKEGQIVEAGDEIRPARYLTERRINNLLE